MFSPNKRVDIKARTTGVTGEVNKIYTSYEFFEILLSSV